MSMKFDFAGKTILVTGGSQGIGFAIAKAFVEAGAHVHITGTREASTYADDLSLFDYHQVRLEDPGARVTLAFAVGDVDVLVNNAAMARQDEYDIAGFAGTMEVNVNASVELCYLFKDSLAARRGAIVNVGSVASCIALRRTPACTASKAAMLGFTRAVADQWARDGIRVNIVAPGYVDTSMNAWAHADEAVHLLKSIPARRLGTPDNVAAAVMFLASPQASYVTGQSLIVDGGLMLR